MGLAGIPARILLIISCVFTILRSHSHWIMWETTIMRHSYKIVSAALLLGILSFLLYSNTLSHKFAFDDKGLIRDNRLIREGTTLKEIFTTNYRYGANNPNDGLYRPLVMFTYVMNTDNTLDPFPLHLWNVILNSITTILFFLLIYSFSRSLVLAIIAGLVFGFHPIHTEVVANISGRPEILCALFLFASWLILKTKSSYSVLTVSLACVCFALALLSKETAVMFPFMIISYDYIIKRSEFWRKRNLITYVMLGVTLIIYLIVRLVLLGDTAAGNDPEFFNNPIADATAASRMATAFGVFLRYIRLLIVPLRLVSDYSYNSLPVYDSLFNPVAMAGIVMLMGMIIAAIALIRRNQLYTLAFILFLFPYLLISNIVFPVGTIMGERLMYLPSAGFALIAGCILTSLSSRWRYLTTCLVLLLMLGYSFKTLTRNRDWHDDITLTTADLKSMPENSKLLVNMGIIKARQKQYSMAEHHYKKALEIYPDLVEAWSGLGKMNYDRGNIEEALRYYTEAVRVARDQPNIRFDHAMTLKRAGDFEGAEEALRDALSSSPTSPILYRGIGNLMLDQDRFSEAVVYYQKAYDLGGSKRILLNNMAAASFYSGNRAGALNYIRIAENLGIRLNQDMVRSIRSGEPVQ